MKKSNRTGTMISKREIKRIIPDTGLNAGAIRVLMYMRDGKWHTRKQIEAAASPVKNRRALEGMRRMRELRDVFKVQKRQVDRYEYLYRLAA